MPTITSIKQQKNKNRVNIYLDSKFGFGIDLDNFALLHLKVDQELTDKEIKDIVKKAEFQKTWEKFLRFAMVRPRSEKEIIDYFRRKKIHESMWKKLIQKLKHFELLDDIKFAKWWVEQRQNFRLLSKKNIVQELRIKGVRKDIIEQVLKEASIDEEKTARELISKREYKWKSLEPRKAKQKKFQFLITKGFDYEIIKKVLSSK
jgi:regulatory protein